MEPGFSVTHEQGVITLTGDLDLATVPYFRAAIVEHEDEPLVVDLAGVEFVDSAGLRAMLEARRLHGDVRYVKPTVQLQRLVELTGTGSLLFAPSI